MKEYVALGFLTLGLMYCSYCLGLDKAEEEHQLKLNVLKQELINTETKYQSSLNNIRKINEDELNQIKESYKALSSCHDDNGIRLLNEEIRKRHRTRELTR